MFLFYLIRRDAAGRGMPRGAGGRPYRAAVGFIYLSRRERKLPRRERAELKPREMPENTAVPDAA